MKRLFENDGIASWIIVCVLVLLGVMVTITSIRIIHLQEFISDMNTDFEDHFASLMNSQPVSAEETNETYKGNISITDAPINGDLNSAKYAIIQFSDYECPYCAQAVPIITEILKKYPQEIVQIQKDYPLPQHQNAKIAAVAARCAGKQNKYWEMADLLFTNQQDLQQQTILDIANKINFNKSDFETCLDGNEFYTIIDENLKEGMALKIAGTPTFIVGTILSIDGLNLSIDGTIVSLSDLPDAVKELMETN